MPEYKIRTMLRQDIDTAIEWAASEGWNPGLHDADSFFNADKNGFFIGEINHIPISTISAVKYGNDFGFIGFYIVNPMYRNRGYGIKIWNHALEYLKGRNIGLDGVVSQQENYKKSGFKLAYRNIRFQGISENIKQENSKVLNLSQLPLPLIEEYDKPLFFGDRAHFLRHWITQSECNALGILYNGKLAGYGVIRICRTGYKIGPLFADTPELAESLFDALMLKIPRGEPIYLDIPEINTEALELARRHNMQIGFETARMYTGEFPELDYEKIYGVTTFELG